MKARAIGRSVVVMVAAGLLVSSAAVASTPNFTMPTAGTATQVASAVAASTKIEKLPSALNPSLPSVPNDTPEDTYLHARGYGCPTVLAVCTYGKTNSKKVVVLLGDSHAWMWLPAVVPSITKAGDKLILLWRIGCPMADVPLWTPSTGIDTACASWRSSVIGTINSLSPKLVILAERTTDFNTADNVLATNAQLTSGLETTIRDLQGPNTKVAVIADTPAFPNFVSPASCMSVYTTDIQKCSTPTSSSNPEWADRSSDEQAAAKQTKATFINPLPWVCTKSTCSPIVGTLDVYMDWSHFTATYAGYLSGVMGSSLKPLL